MQMRCEARNAMTDESRLMKATEMPIMIRGELQWDNESGGLETRGRRCSHNMKNEGTDVRTCRVGGLEIRSKAVAVTFTYRAAP